LKFHLLLILLLSISFSNTRSIYSVGDTLTVEDQSLEYNVCHSDENYMLGDNFSLSDYNGNLNGGNYKVFLISMNATW
tara:strand:- start:554 stop:787 length:234 start_codon:yes stop_codon:yes gene_type:complete